MKCVICGKEIKRSEYMNAVLCSFDCFRRLFWKEALDDTALIIDGECYHISPENAPGTRGYGGREFMIQKNDGEIIKTTNLWHQGKIPDYAYQQDNAKFEGMTITPFDDDAWLAQMTLTSDDGDTLEYDVADEAEFEQMIVGMQIVDFTED